MVKVTFDYPNADGVRRRYTTTLEALPPIGGKIRRAHVPPGVFEVADVVLDMDDWSWTVVVNPFPNEPVTLEA